MKSIFGSFANSFLVLSPILLFGLYPAKASVLEADHEISDGSYTVVTTGDLLDGATALSSTETGGGFQAEGSAGLSALTDGEFGYATGGYGSGAPNSGSSNASSAMGGPSGGTAATYSLGSDPLGYSLSSIEVLSGWNDSGRYQQAYTISYLLVATLADPNPTFTALYTVSPYPSNAYQSGDIDNGAETVLTSSSGPLVTGVSEVEITFNSIVNGYTGYREFAVYGTPVTTPEPSSIALMLGGIFAVGIFVRHRSRKSA